MERLIAAFVLGITAVSCARMIPLDRDQLPALATYRATGGAVVRSGGYTIRIERRHRPNLAIRPNCTFAEETLHRRLCSGSELSDDLDKVDVEPDRLVFHDLWLFAPNIPGVTRTEDGGRIVELAHVRDAMLRLHGYRLEGWRPKWGVGVSLAGASMLASFTGQYRPVSWLALDLGLAPIPTAWLGARGLFPAVGPVRGFVGAAIFANAYNFTSDPRVTALASGRAGFDVALGSEQDLLTLEFDLMRRLDNVAGGTFLYCSSERAVCPWGGIAYTHFF